MRCDGRKVTQDEPIYFLIPYFLTHRYDAMNMITVDVPEEPLRKYMNEKRKAGTPVNHMALLITAWLRTLSKYPDLNRFIGGRTIYEHVDKTVAMVVLRPGGGESMNKMELEDADTVFDDTLYNLFVANGKRGSIYVTNGKSATLADGKNWNVKLFGKSLKRT